MSHLGDSVVHESRALFGRVGGSCGYARNRASFFRHLIDVVKHRIDALFCAVYVFALSVNIGGHIAHGFGYVYRGFRRLLGVGSQLLAGCRNLLGGRGHFLYECAKAVAHCVERFGHGTYFVLGVNGYVVHAQIALGKFRCMMLKSGNGRRDARSKFHAKSKHKHQADNGQYGVSPTHTADGGKNEIIRNGKTHNPTGGRHGGKGEHGIIHAPHAFNDEKSFVVLNHFVKMCANAGDVADV